MSNRERNIITCVLLTIVTCGLYSIYWMYQICSDLYRLNNEEDKAGMDLVFSIITCGIFTIYLYYKWGKMVDSARRRYDLHPRDDSLLFVILGLVGLSIVNYCIVQSQINNELIPAENKAEVLLKSDSFMDDDRRN